MLSHNYISNYCIVCSCMLKDKVETSHISCNPFGYIELNENSTLLELFVEHFYVIVINMRSLLLSSIGFNCQRFMYNGQETLYFDESGRINPFPELEKQCGCEG